MQRHSQDPTQLNTIKKIESLLTKAKTPKHIIDLQNELASAVRYRDVHRGIALSLDAHSAAQKLPYPKGIAESAYNLSRFNSVYLGCNEKASYYANLALEQFRIIQDNAGEARTHLLLASLHLLGKDHTASFEHLRAGLEIAHQENSPDLEAAAYAEYGTYYKQLHELHSAIEYYMKALTIWKTTRHLEGEAVVTQNLGAIYNLLGNTAESMKYYTMTLELRKTLHDEFGVSSALHNIASFYIRGGDYENALSNFHQSLDIKQKIGYRLGEADTYNNIGSIYGEMKNYSMARKYHELSLDIYKELHIHSKIALALNNISVDEMRLGNVEKGLEIALESYTISKENGNIQGVISSCLNVATVYKALHDYTNALLYAEEGLTHCRSIHRSGQYPSFFIEIASILYHIGKYDSAEVHLLNAIELCQEFHAKQLLVMAYYALSQVYEQLEQPTKSLSYLRLYVELQSELQDETALHRSHLLLNKIELQQVKSENTSIITKFEQIEQEQKLCKRELQLIGLHLVEKQEFLKQVNTIIQQNLQQYPVCTACNLHKLLPVIEAKIEGNSQWQVFTEKFDRSHDEFIKRLSNTFPDLTQTELKVATLLRINMENKDIANLLCSSVRTVEWHRRNIRKKMQLKAHESLSVILNGW